MLNLILIALFFSIAGGVFNQVIHYGLNSASRGLLAILFMIIFFFIVMVATHTYIFFNKKTAREGGPLRRQLVFVFTLLVLAASIPQSILSMKILEGVMEYWVGDSLEDTLEDGSRFILSYYGLVSRNLENLGRSSWLDEKMEEYTRTGDFPWEELKELNSFIDTLQVFHDGSSFLYGQEEYSAEREFIESYVNNFLPVRTRGERILLSYKADRHGVSFVITSSLIPGTEVIGREFDDQIDRMVAYNQYSQDSLRWRLYFILFFAFPLLLISLNMALLFAHRQIYPIHELGQALRRVTRGDYSYRISVEDFGVFDFYADIFNEMIDELNSSRSELVQTEKIGVWRDIAQRLAHEIRNPLTPIKLSAQRILLKTADMDEETQNYLRIPMNRILKEVDELDLLLREFREFAGQRAPVLRELGLQKLIGEVWDSYGKEGENIIFSLHDEVENRIVLGDYSQLKQVFRNVFSNALDAMDGKGRLSVRINSIIKGTANFCRVTVRDWGRGIDEEVLTRIFEPYYTTRKTGTGLGLPIVERIITDHKGRIWVESSPGEGTVFYIDLPTGREL